MPIQFDLSADVIAMFDGSVSAVRMVDMRGDIVFNNQTITFTLGHLKSDVMPQNINRLMPTSYRIARQPLLTRYFQRLLSGGMLNILINPFTRKHLMDAILRNL